MPTVLRDAARTGVVAAALIVGTGALAVGLALAVRGGDAADIFGSYRAGVLGQAGITLLCLAFAPNVAVWGSAYLLGPGFGVGADTMVSPGEVVLGPIPAVPLLAGLPSGPVSGVGLALLGVPLAAATWAGWLLARRHPHLNAWTGVLGPAALAGPVAGLLLQLAASASAGALGSGRLAVLGPTGWAVCLYATVAVAVGAVTGATAARSLSRNFREVVASRGL